MCWQLWNIIAFSSKCRFCSTVDSSMYNVEFHLVDTSWRSQCFGKPRDAWISFKKDETSCICLKWPTIQWHTARMFFTYLCEIHYHGWLKPGSQFDPRTSVVLWASGWRWNRLDFYSSVASRALASVQPIRLSKNLTSGMQFDWWKDFSDVRDARGASVILWTRLNCNVWEKQPK